MNITKQQIQQCVENIMIIDGPNGHTDGSDVITDFIISLLQYKHEEFIENYEKQFESFNGLNSFTLKKIL